jgi:hypothetical protein
MELTPLLVFKYVLAAVGALAVAWLALVAAVIAGFCLLVKWVDRQ